MIAAVIATAVVFLVLGFICGVNVANKGQLRQALREAGFTKDSAKLYARAAKILRRLDSLTQLDGDMAVDILSDTTKKQVSDWLADYRKGLDSL